MIQLRVSPQTIYRAVRLPLADQLIAGEAFLLLVFSGFAIRVLPRRLSVRLYGMPLTESPEHLPPAIENRAAHIARILGAVKRNLPWQTTCLPEAVAARLMLTRRRIPSTLYIGVTRQLPHSAGDAADLYGHAWLRAGRTIITGQDAHTAYQVMVHYGTNPQ